MSALRINQAPGLFLPLTLLSRYLYFLCRRPVSGSNSHFADRRIRGLQTLAVLLRDHDDPQVERLADLLQAMTGANLFRQSAAIHHLLKHRTAETLPGDVVVSYEPPSAAFWHGTRRILLVFGPGIGIGDEIICFPIPAALASLSPGAEISVLSAYAGLWDRVGNVARVDCYHGASDLIDAFRGAHASDLIFFADFEPPGLTAAVCHEPAVARYVELSLGTRALSVFDEKSRQIFRMPSLDPYFANFYACLEHMMQWLGAPVGLTRDGRTEAREPNREMNVVVSPFTSKEDPSEQYWSRLIAQMIPPDLCRPVRIAIDTGATRASEAMARALSRSAVNPAHPDMRCEVAQCASGRNVPLPDMLECLRNADVVVTADSFPAHAAALFGRLTFVIGRQGVENWRAPSPASFYLPAEASVNRIAATIRTVLRGRFDMRDDRRFQRLLKETNALRDAFHAPWEILAENWNSFTSAYLEILPAIDTWPEASALLLTDRPYHQLCASAPHTGGPAARIHLEDRFFAWTNSNLYKYLRLEPL